MCSNHMATLPCAKLHILNTSIFLKKRKQIDSWSLVFSHITCFKEVRAHNPNPTTPTHILDSEGLQRQSKPSAQNCSHSTQLARWNWSSPSFFMHICQSKQWEAIAGLRKEASLSRSASSSKERSLLHSRVCVLHTGNPSFDPFFSWNKIWLLKGWKNLLSKTLNNCSLRLAVSLRKAR